MKTDSLRLYVIAVLVLQAACTAILWVLNVLSVGSTQAFELLVAANLVGFAIVLQAYRNPDSISRGDEAKPAAQPAAASGPSTTANETIHSRTHTKTALPPSIHVAIPIASIVVLLAFAVVLFLPSNKSALPPTSTVVYIPVYLVIVVVLVFGSMYLFKRLLDAEAPAES